MDWLIQRLQPTGRRTLILSFFVVFKIFILKFFEGKATFNLHNAGKSIHDLQHTVLYITFSTGGAIYFALLFYLNAISLRLGANYCTV